MKQKTISFQIRRDADARSVYPLGLSILSGCAQWQRSDWSVRGILGQRGTISLTTITRCTRLESERRLFSYFRLLHITHWRVPNTMDQTHGHIKDAVPFFVFIFWLMCSAELDGLAHCPGQDDGNWKKEIINSAIQPKQKSATFNWYLGKD